MKISVNWLSDYVALPSSVDELARRLTMAGLEVEGLTRQDQGLASVVVAQIIEATKHPNADKLSVTKVDDGSGTPLQVVCGAKNFKVGDKVPLARVGSTLPNGVTIGKAVMREVESFGMLCSAKELGLTEESQGLLILDAALPVGTPIAKALGLDDVVLEVNVTPNRSDALSHLGIAREVAALVGAELRRPQTSLAPSTRQAASEISVRIDDPERCWRYAARVIEGVRVAESPAWLQGRLKAAGVRAISNLVDVTNYVMLEYGQPLHAFDLDRIGGKQIVIRTAKAGETLTTLDGKARTLHGEDLLICDAAGPLVLAGVMGGESSEVTASTTRVLLEAASFQPRTVRRSSKRHGLHTESSHRFERGTDVSVLPQVLDRAAALIVETAGGTVLEGIVDLYPTKTQPKEVTLHHARVEQLLGAPVPTDDAHRILSALGFVKLVGDALESRWAVPLARVDVGIEEDLVEEIARVRGFEAIEPALPRGLSALEPERPLLAIERRLRMALAGQGVDEVVNYSFVGPNELDAFEARTGAIAVSNPLSVEQSLMRTTLFASLVPNVARSARHQAEGVRFYELGRSYRPHEGPGDSKRTAAVETPELAGALWGLRGAARSWTSKEERVDFYDAKAVVQSVLSALHIEHVTWQPFESPWYHPRASAQLRLGAQVLGTVGELHPRAQKALDAPSGVFLFQLLVEPLAAHSMLVPQAAPLSRFPSVLRDLAVVVPASLPADEVRAVILEVGRPLVHDAKVFDVYEGKQLGEGRKNVAFALTYRAAERTLTDVEVTQAHDHIVAEVTKRLGGSLRG